MQIKIVPSSSVKPPSWRATHILRPDSVLLRTSLIESGWLQPIVARLSDQTIIDGTARWHFACTEERFVKRHGSSVPVVYHDVDEVDAMILHVRLNRARGFVHPVLLSKIVKRIFASNKYGDTELATILAMSDDEIELLATGDLIKRKDLEKYEYSRAWIPIEVPKATEVESSIIERPPNADR
jgi:ParB-like chromosome segregation protein Spo0J